MAIVNRIAEFADDMKTWRHWLHRNPELAFNLPKTTGYVAERLREFGVDEVHEGIGRSGIVGILRGRGDGPCIGLRADMDALPIVETTGSDHASATPGKMHACGHDGHTAMLLGAARYLAETRNFAGSVALIFQPAEEIGGGAAAMLADGMMDRFGIAEIYGMHTSPILPLGEFKTTPGPMLAAVSEFTVTLTGLGGHGASPHRTRDPLAAGLQVAQAFQSILARNMDASEKVVVSLCQFHAGSAFNIVPADAMLNGTVRTYSQAVQDRVRERMTDICAGIARAMEVEIALDFSLGFPATVNHPDQAMKALSVAQALVGADRARDDFRPVMGGEDFAYFLQARPGAFVSIGQGPRDGATTPYLHDPKFDFNDETSPYGASFFARLVETLNPARP